MNLTDFQKKAAKIRLDTLLAIHKAGKGSSGSCMSVVEILTALYYGELHGGPVLKSDPAKPGWDGQDYLVLSKGQAVPALYSILADKGFFERDELNYLGKEGALLREMPSAKIPGITAPVNSHGHGLSIALGMALSLKMDRKANRVFAVLGDGELQEGQVWEAAMAATHHKLNNLIVLIDNNGMQAGGPLAAVMNIGSVQDKFEAFGWNVYKVLDGHNFDEILRSVERGFTSVRKPVCIWCKTVAGKGIDFAERKPGYLNVPLSEGEIAEVVPGLAEICGLDLKI